MKLHRSKTSLSINKNMYLFNYHMKLHRSKTSRQEVYAKIRFNYHMKLHRSKTLDFGRVEINDLTTI